MLTWGCQGGGVLLSWKWQVKNGNIFSKNAPQCLLRYGRQRRAPGRRVIAEAIDSTMGA